MSKFVDKVTMINMRLAKLLQYNNAALADLHDVPDSRFPDDDLKYLEGAVVHLEEVVFCCMSGMPSEVWSDFDE